MGGTTSTDYVRAGDDDDIKTYWTKIVHSSNTMGDCDLVKKGGAMTIGGIDDLTTEYDLSVSSKAKRDLIKKLSDGISKAMKVSPPSSSASNDEMVAHLVKIVPNPRKGKSIIANKEKQSKLCLDLADIINKNYGNVIDKSLGPDGVCNQVSDVVDSLSAGLNQEYVTVAASVERVIGNLQDLKEMLERSYSKLYTEAANSDDESLKLSINGIKAMHDLIMQEVQRQLVILSNITRTNLRETQRDLASMLAKNEDFKGLVQSIKSSVGTSEWGDKLGFWLSGINNTAQMALRVDDALKIIGMKASEYKQSSKLSDLTMKTHEIMEKVPSSKMTKDYLSKYEKAVEVLKKHHGHHPEISKRVKGAAEVDFMDSVAAGGRVKLEKKIKTQQKTRLLMIRDFKAKMKILMDRVYQSIFRAGRRIGSGDIKLTDDLYRFKTILEDLSNIFKEGIEYSLTGYYTHANAVQHKDRFLGLLTSMLQALDSLKSQDEIFRDIAANIESVVKLMDFFNDKFNVNHNKVLDDRTSSFEHNVDGGGEFKAAVTLKNAKNTFNHFYKLAKFKINLKQTSIEMKSYTKNYSAIVGSAVAKRVDSIRSGLSETVKDLDSDTKYKPGLKSIADDEWNVDDITEILTKQVSAKENLYRVAQSVDEYLQKFTDAVIVSPTDVSEVSKLLGSVDIMSNWFNEKSGDSIASLYEIFPWSRGGLAEHMNTELQKKTCGENMKSTPRTHVSGHYYSAVSEHTSTNKKPGNPFHPVSPSRALFAHRFAKYTVDKIYVLKNIVSAFAHLGKKFGDQDLTNASFMSPNDMYKCLCEYLYVSAFTTGWGVTNTTQTYGKQCNKTTDLTPQLGLQQFVLAPGGSRAATATDSSNVKWDFGCVMSSIEFDDSDICMTGWKSQFCKEDKIFVNIIKAMAAKVFTVTGLYNMMSFSSNLKTHALSPGRLILGGGATGGDDFTYQTPKIYTEALELYARLPLLAEFYRGIFCFEDPCDDEKNPTDKDALLISMVPEVGSMWAGFIRTVFEQPLNTGGLYTPNALKRMIHEINNVYQTYMSKGSKDVVTTVISDFIAEINSRYGLMNRGEMEKYRHEENDRRTDATFPEMMEDPDDFDILDEDNIGTGVAPSDRYVTVSSSTQKSEHDLDGDMYNALKVFRRRIDTRVSKYVLKSGTDGSDDTNWETSSPDFGRLILSTRETLKTMESPEEQFSLISQMMVGMDSKTQTNKEANVMFHETIVAPLAVLTSISNILKNYSEQCQQWNAPALFKYLWSKGLVPRGQDSLYDNNLDLLIGKIMSKIDVVEQLKKTNESSKEIVDNLLLTAGLQTKLRSLSSAMDREANWNGVKLSPDGSDKDKLGERTAAYTLMKLDVLFKHLTNLVYGLSADLGSMCEVQFVNGNIMINHTKLQGICEEVFSAVRKNFDKFRGVVKTDKLREYETTDNCGSIPWLQRELFDNLLNDLDRKSGLKRAHHIVTESFQLISNKFPGDRSKPCTYGNVQSMDGVLSEMTHYNSSTMSTVDKNGADIKGSDRNNEPYSNYASTESLQGVLTDNDAFSHLMKKHADAANKSRDTDIRFAARYDHYLQNSASGRKHPGFRGDTNRDGEKTRYPYVDGKLDESSLSKVDTGMGLMMKFNEVMAAYLKQFWDPTALKIYSPLIEGPANGPMNQEVFKMKGWPDLAPVTSSSDKDVMDSLVEKLGNDPVAENIQKATSGGDYKRKNLLFNSNIPYSYDGKSLNGNSVDLVGMLTQNLVTEGNPSEVLSQQIVTDIKIFHEMYYNSLGNTLNTGVSDTVFIRVSGLQGGLNYRNEHIKANRGVRHMLGWKYVLKMKREIIGALREFSEIDPSSLDWVKTLTKIMSEQVKVLSDQFKNNERDRIEGVISTCFLRNDDYTEAIKDASLKSEIDTVVNVGYNHIVNVLDKYKDLIIKSSMSYKSVHFTAMFATILCEPLTNNLTEMNNEWSKHIESCDFTGFSFDNVQAGGVQLFNEAYSKAGGTCGRLNPYAYILDGMIDPSDILIVELTNIMISERPWYNDHALYGSYVSVIQENIDSANAGGDFTTSFKSKLVGMGVCDTDGQLTPVDFMSVKQTGGYGSGSTDLDKLTTAVSQMVQERSDRYQDSTDSLEEKHISGAPSTGMGDPRSLLFASLSKAMLTALTETSTSGVKLNITSSIAEVPLRTKEMMKAHLPTFNEMFKLITKRADLLKGVIKLGIDCKRASNAVLGLPAMDGVHGGLDDVVKREHDESVLWYMQHLDRITTATESMSNTCETVMNELNDSPLYLEVNEDSIVNYKNRYAKQPFMPLSSATVVLQPAMTSNPTWTGTKQHPRRDPMLAYPGTSSGNVHFSYSYGTRMLLHDYSSKPLIEHMPGVKDVLDKYNMVSNSSKKFEEKVYGQYMGKVVELLRFASSTRLFSGLFGAERRFVDDSRMDEKHMKLPAYQMTQQLSAVVGLTTNSDKESQVSNVAEWIDDMASTGKVSRESAIIYNILDLNISPINVHAMRREIPLVNLYNYAFTFDSCVTDCTQSNYSGVGGNDHTMDDKQMTSHAVLSSITKNPYIRVPKGTFYKELRKVVSGENTLGFQGQPKFISDQLWNKVLLQDSVSPKVRRMDVRSRTGDIMPNSSPLISDKDYTTSERAYLAELGRLRFDSKFARNMFFLTNVQRMITYKIKNELTSAKFPVASGEKTTDRKITDYMNGEEYSSISID